MRNWIRKITLIALLVTAVVSNVSKEEEERLKKLLNITKLPENYDVVYPKHQETVGRHGGGILPRIYGKRSKTSFKNNTEYYNLHES